jgi:hypothetical protein
MSVDRPHLKEGRADYKPWLRIFNVPSLGRSHRLRGIKTGRVLSPTSRSTLFYLLDWHEAVVEIREQFPPSSEATWEEAVAPGSRAGARHMLLKLLRFISLPSDEPNLKLEEISQGRSQVI